MVLEEKEKFYNADRKLYLVGENGEFLDWYYSNMKYGYVPATSLEEIQDLIDTIVIWFEFKYPSKYFGVRKSRLDAALENPDDLSKFMDIAQLKMRLTQSETVLFDCLYRMGCGHNYVTGIVNVRIKDNYSNETYYINLGDRDGLINSMDLDFLEGSMNFSDATISIAELYSTLKGNPRYDIEELKRVFLHHKTDLKLRKQLLEFINLALIYSKKTTPELGYERAKLFSAEMSEYFGIDLEVPEFKSLPVERKTKKISKAMRIMNLKSKIDTEVARII